MVMTTGELKNILIHRIAGINDKSFLTAIKAIIETKSKSIVYKITWSGRTGFRRPLCDTENPESLFERKRHYQY